MMDEYGGMVERRFARENRRKIMNNLLQCLFVHHEYHMKPSGIEPETQRCDMSVRDYTVLFPIGTSRQERLGEGRRRYAKGNKGNAKRLWPSTSPDLIF
jgi:hypothetical protein